MIAKAGLSVAPQLAAFIEEQVLPGLDIAPRRFWEGAARIFADFTPPNRALLEKRDALQQSIDAWHMSAENFAEAYQRHLRAVGYLQDEPAPFRITTESVDAEVAQTAGPQLVVPALNARFLLNAANARWASLYDALYGTDALGPPPAGETYDPARGAQVIARAKEFLDMAAPLASGRHADIDAYTIENGALHPSLSNPDAFIGWRGDAGKPDAILLRHHGLHIEILLDRTHRIGRTDPAGVADIVLEAAISTIVDLEDSVAAVDADDKVQAYAHWLAVLRGDLEASFVKDGRVLTRRLAENRFYSAPDGGQITLPGRSLLMVRNVGLHMTTPALLLPDRSDAYEGILDAIVTTLIGLYDLRGLGRWRNSSAGSLYVVKPKLHGPEEAAFVNRLFEAVEDMLDLPRHSVKIGLMDEERRTSANLAACIHALKQRLAFINTGFLDRTGDEIHTSMRAGAMMRKGQMRTAPWLQAYEDRNVRIGLACGLSGKAQIGKGMWAAPDRMAEMLAQKIAHPRAGANTAWVPSPTAAALHALHYHEIDVFARQAEIARELPPQREHLLQIPLARAAQWSDADIREELESNAQSILGYVARWIDQGVGCSKVPDISDIALMEDRATLRISSQLLSNWLVHGVCSEADIDRALRRMAAKVDGQNAGDPLHRPMSGHEDGSLAFQAARALILEGADQPNGYTEAILHHYRRLAKATAQGVDGANIESMPLAPSERGS